jgi:hypothetical protein
MDGEFCSAGTLSGAPRFTLLFAREPEPHADLELNEPGGARPSSAGAPAPRKPRLKVLLLILLVLVVAGGAYVAMDPEMLMTLMDQEQPPSRPPASTPAPVRPLVPDATSPARTSEAEGAGTMAALGIVPTPLFGEGQLVSVRPNPVSPVISLALSQDAAGSRPGPTLNVGATLRVLDAELHEHTWVYLVRSDAGIQGWIPEGQLIAKP